MGVVKKDTLQKIFLVIELETADISDHIIISMSLKSNNSTNMRVILLLALVFPTIAKSAYPGIVMTSVDAKILSETRVEFSGRIEGKEDDTTAIIIKNVIEDRWEGSFWNRHPIFQADLVSPRELKASVKKPLLAIHGFNVQPESHLKQCKEARDKFEKFDLIPVIWPSTGGVTNYLGDRGYSKGAGKAFRTLKKYAGMFPRKSLLAHSMGNRVLRYAADGDFMFDNVFMAAADVDNRIFNKNYIDDNSEDRRKDGLRICRMLNNVKSKIYCLHNGQDYALLGSTVQKLGTGRLGLGGTDESKVHPELKGKVVNVNCGQKWLNWGMNFAAHSYQWDDEAIKFYDSKCI